MAARAPGFVAHVALYSPTFQRWLSAGRHGDANVDADQLKDFEVFDLHLISYDANTQLPRIALKSHAHNKWMRWERNGEIRIDRERRDDAETAFLYSVKDKPGHVYLQPFRGAPDLWYGCDHRKSVLKPAPREWEQWKLVALDPNHLPKGGNGLLGGIVGAVGGAVTGLLAGGPIGAGVGAVAGAVVGVINGEKGVTYVSVGFPMPAI